MAQTKVSTKYQIVIPKRIREKLEIAPGMNLHIEIVDANRAILHTKKVSVVKALRGLGKEVWKNLGGADTYLKHERAAWDG
ncbi:AbrB/MazE/SpoVT family DNA-binding domain-containing protein [Candidatus Uhrbacteria bacterium]|nr:AbrB/MazE/SpoVT family DNA-binding domain-containing protein [Candidatus Uhrbacteria bacterium]